jgi:hypothetical protein
MRSAWLLQTQAGFSEVMEFPIRSLFDEVRSVVEELLPVAATIQWFRKWPCSGRKFDAWSYRQADFSSWTSSAVNLTLPPLTWRPSVRSPAVGAKGMGK